MAEAKTSVANRPAWVDLSTSDAAGARDFYGKLFGWKIEVNEDPQYGGYALAKVDGEDVAGIGPKQDPNGPNAWALYIGTEDAAALAGKVTEAGGTVVAPPFDVGPQGKMAVFQDPTGAFIYGWQPALMAGFHSGHENQFGWAELNARGIDKALAFYGKVFGWTDKASPMGEGMGDYHEMQLGGRSVAGGMEMMPNIPAEVPSYWSVYFMTRDVDGSFKKALELGATEMVPPSDFPGGRFAILSDPQGAMFGLLSLPSGG